MVRSLSSGATPLVVAIALLHLPDAVLAQSATRDGIADLLRKTDTAKAQLAQNAPAAKQTPAPSRQHPLSKRIRVRARPPTSRHSA